MNRRPTRCGSTRRARQPGEICRQFGASEATFCAWKKKKYAHLGVSELRGQRQLREENGRLKRAVADLKQDKQILSAV